jgi:hypothetical protein
VTVAAPAAKRVQIEALSARTELGNVLRVAMAISVGVWMYLATNGATFQGRRSELRNLLPFQLLIRDRPSSEQRIFRELQEGLLEAEARRAVDGKWPPIALLSNDGVPPFAPDPTARGSRYDWRLITAGTFVNYLGLPEQAGAPAWLVLVQEPEPGRPPDQTWEDEEHHRLANGPMLHVSTWLHAEGTRVADRIVRMPQAEGWMQLYAVGPAVSPAIAPGAASSPVAPASSFPAAGPASAR